MKRYIYSILITKEAREQLAELARLTNRTVGGAFEWVVNQALQAVKK